MGGRGAEPNILRLQQKNSGVKPRVGPRRNIGDGCNVLQDGFEKSLEKTNTMVCTPGFVWGKWGEHVYERRETGGGATFQ